MKPAPAPGREIFPAPRQDVTERRIEPDPQTDRRILSLRDCREMLRGAGLRPTRQRVMLSWVLFSRGNRHITAEMLYSEASDSKIPVSLATVYNTLHQFADASLLRQIGVDGAKAFFDTNPGDHHHFFVEDEQTVLDIPESDMAIGQLPEAPAGFEIARVDVTVRLRRKQI